MKHFNTKEEALEYAKELGKRESEIVEVAGKKTLLSSTSLPIESRFRLPIELMINEIVREFGDSPCDDEIADKVIEMGAELSEILVEKTEEYLGYQTISRYENF